MLREVDNTLMTILTQMQTLAKSLPEYPVVRAMGGVGNVLAPKLIAEIGDVRRFHSGKESYSDIITYNKSRVFSLVVEERFLNNYRRKFI